MVKRGKSAKQMVSVASISIWTERLDWFIYPVKNSASTFVGYLNIKSYIWGTVPPAPPPPPSLSLQRLCKKLSTQGVNKTARKIIYDAVLRIAIPCIKSLNFKPWKFNPPFDTFSIITFPSSIYSPFSSHIKRRSYSQCFSWDDSHK